MANQAHEINILKNVIEKAEGLSQRLVDVAKHMIAAIEAEVKHIEGKDVAHDAVPQPTPAAAALLDAAQAQSNTEKAAAIEATAKANGLSVSEAAQGTNSTPSSSAPETLDEKANDEFAEHPNDGEASLEELRATGDYTEAELEELCKDHGVTYTANETPSLQAQGITETASAAPLAGEATASTAAKG